ncbi:MAG: tRNA (guanine(46)-N(7))-methyltransferase TrmB [Rhodospirillales bacterium]
MTDPAKYGQIRTYGRRRGRPLKPQRAGLMRDLLPLVAVPAAALSAGRANLDPRTLFDFSPAEIWLELGFGSGEHLAAQAASHPAIGFIGCEPFENGVAALLRHVAAGKLKNVRIHPDDSRPLIDVLADASVARLFVLFPDPWPKKRHHRRRLVSAAMLGQFARILRGGGRLRLATDDPAYAAEMDELAAAHPGFARLGGGVAARGWRPDDAPISRSVEKARRKGAAPAFIELERRKR